MEPQVGQTQAAVAAVAEDHLHLLQVDQAL
jgi:hypothetical protein